MPTLPHGPPPSFGPHGDKDLCQEECLVLGIQIDKNLQEQSEKREVVGSEKVPCFLFKYVNNVILYP